MPGVFDLDDAFANGVTLAAERMQRHGIEPPPIQDVAATLDAARHLLDAQPGVMASRAVELWSETVAIAASARVLYDEPPLGPVELRNFFETWQSVINSWRHPPP
jgi:hypothetical protein